MCGSGQYLAGPYLTLQHLAVCPLTINLPDGTKVMSTHTCDITIPGLPKVLVGHVVPKLSIASLIGIRVLCDAGCEVVFKKTKCDVWYKGKVILRGKKDPSTDLWTLPIDAKSGKKLDAGTVPKSQKRNSTVSQKLDVNLRWPVSPTQSRRGQTQSSLHTSHCATQKYRPYSRRCDAASLTGALT